MGILSYTALVPQILFTIALVPFVVTACPNNLEDCQWVHWQEWGPCSTTCGKGRRFRRQGLCCSKWKTFNECYNKCGLTDFDNEYGVCNNGCTKGELDNWLCVCYEKFYGNCCENSVLFFLFLLLSVIVVFISL